MKKVHFIGICGAGMSAVAKLLLDLGIEVTGSDEGFYPPISDYLTENKIPFLKGHKKENLESGGTVQIDTVVIGTHAKLTVEENPEVAFAFELQKQGKVKIFSFPEILQKITNGELGLERENIVVAGSFREVACFHSGTNV